MNARTIVTTLLALSFALPLGAAEVPSCADVTDGSAVALAGLYVGGGGVWQESNRMPGLQTADCSDDNGRDRLADTQIA